jgi:hypothetical protein
MDVAKIDLNAGSAGARPVVNLEVWAALPDDTADFAYRAAPSGCAIGWLFDDTDVTPPPRSAAEKKADAAIVVRETLAAKLALPWTVDWTVLVGVEIQKKDWDDNLTDAGELDFPPLGMTSEVETRLAIRATSMIAASEGTSVIGGLRDLSDAYELQPTAEQFLVYYNTRTAVASDYRAYAAGVIGYIDSLADDAGLAGGIAAALLFPGAPWPADD